MSKEWCFTTFNFRLHLIMLKDWGLMYKSTGTSYPHELSKIWLSLTVTFSLIHTRMGIKIYGLLIKGKITEVNDFWLISDFKIRNFGGLVIKLLQLRKWGNGKASLLQPRKRLPL